MQKRAYYLWLSRLELDPIKLKKILKVYGVEKIWNLQKNELEKFFNIEEINKISNLKYRQNLDKYEDFINKNKINFITIEDEDYPNTLKNIEDCPIFLYTLGNKKLLKQKSIAIIGSRTASEYGKNMSQAFSYLLAKRNITIVSGLACGIDSFAHEGSLMAQGKTIAVFGTGIDLVYPKENKELVKRIIENDGLIISEYPLGSRPKKDNFPKRNRIISGISQGVLVIEAKEKSGALITVDYALEQGKEVYAVPRKYYK